MSWIKAFAGIWMEFRHSIEGATHGSRRPSLRNYHRQVLRPRAA